MTQITDNRRYHEIYDNGKYLAIRAQVEHDINHDQDISYVIMNLLIDVCIETSRGMVTDKIHELARVCVGLSLDCIHRMTEYITLFEMVGSGGVGADIYLMVQVHHKVQAIQEQLQVVVAISGNIHGVRGQMLHHLLHASSNLVDASIALQTSSHADYVGEKVRLGLKQVTYALEAGLQDSHQDSAYDFSTHDFPQAKTSQDD
ncbi:MAG: hypothetical protein WBC91_13780 [Phototrophicaceae bacterium]